jgi:hypothetical protein
MVKAVSTAQPIHRTVPPPRHTHRQSSCFNLVEKSKFHPMRWKVPKAAVGNATRTTEWRSCSLVSRSLGSQGNGRLRTPQILIQWELARGIIQWLDEVQRRISPWCLPSLSGFYQNLPHAQLDLQDYILCFNTCSPILILIKDTLQAARPPISQFNSVLSLHFLVFLLLLSLQEAQFSGEFSPCCTANFSR